MQNILVESIIGSVQFSTQSIVKYAMSSKACFTILQQHWRYHAVIGILPAWGLWLVKSDLRFFNNDRSKRSNINEKRGQSDKKIMEKIDTKR